MNSTISNSYICPSLTHCSPIACVFINVFMVGVFCVVYCCRTKYSTVKLKFEEVKERFPTHMLVIHDPQQNTFLSFFKRMNCFKSVRKSKSNSAETVEMETKEAPLEDPDEMASDHQLQEANNMPCAKHVKFESVRGKRLASEQQKTQQLPDLYEKQVVPINSSARARWHYLWSAVKWGAGISLLVLIASATSWFDACYFYNIIFGIL